MRNMEALNFENSELIVTIVCSVESPTHNNLHNDEPITYTGLTIGTSHIM